MAISFIPSRSVLSGGLAGVAAFALVLIANRYGIVEVGGVPVNYETALTVMTTVGAIVTHLVPDSIKDHARALNVKIEDVAKILPTTFDKYPSGKNGSQDAPVQSNQVWKK